MKDGEHLAAWLVLLVAAILCGPTTLKSEQESEHREAHLTDGSILFLEKITYGTNHTHSPKRWYDLLNPFKTQANYGWKDQTPSVVLWCHWQGLKPTTPPPQFTLVFAGGATRQEMTPGACLRDYTNMVAIEKIEGMFAWTTADIVGERMLRIEISQAGAGTNRVRAGEFRMRNPAYSK